MWAKFGRCTEESKKVASHFSGSPDSQWGTSSASYAQSIEMLKSTAWEEIEDGALEFAKFGRRFKTVPSGIKDVRAYIMDCDSDDDSISSSVNGQDENEQEHAASLVERNWEQWNCDEDVPSPPSALTAPQILDSYTAGSQPTQLQSLVSADTAAFQSRFQTTIGVMDTTCQQLLPLTLACSQENTSPFIHKTSVISLPPLTADQFSVHCSPALASENMSGPGHHQVHQHSVPDQGSSDHTNMWQDPYMMLSGLQFGNKFLTGPLRTIDADNDLDY